MEIICPDIQMCIVNNRIYVLKSDFNNRIIQKLLLLWRVSLLRPAPFELPQGGNAARVEGCSGAIKGACPFFF